jgi:hypothetical protein
MWRCYPTRTAKPKRQHTFGGHRQPRGDFTGVVKVGFALKALSSALKVSWGNPELILHQKQVLHQKGGGEYRKVAPPLTYKTRAARKETGLYT